MQLSDNFPKESVSRPNILKNSAGGLMGQTDRVHVLSVLFIPSVLS